jgi:membrane protein YqaA with SNARE-associated domain
VNADWLELGGLFVSAFVSSTVAPGGSEAVLAYLAAGGKIAGGALLSVATIGNTLGAMTTWGLGLWAASRYRLERLESGRRRKAVESVRRYGFPILLFSWLPVVGDAFCFAAGWLRMGFWPCLWLIAAGKALRYGAILYVFV